MAVQLEALEERIVFGVVKIYPLPPLPISEVSGTANNDRISVRIADENHVVVNVNGAEKTYPLSESGLVIYGNRGDDVIAVENSTARVVTIYGGAGNDTITGSLLGDRILAGTGNDVVSAGNGRDTVYGEAGEDSIRGNAHGDLLDGGDGADTLRGDAGNDNISGGANSDRLRGSDGNDTLDGGGSRDFLAGEAGQDFLAGGTGDDYLAGGLGTDQLDGGRDADTIEDNPDETTAFANVEFASKIDVTNNKLITQQPMGTWDGTAYSGVTGLVQSGRGGWNDTGIVTSQTDAMSTSLTSLGVATASDLLHLGQGQTATFAGQTIGADSVLVMYTYGGDVDLDGDLDGDDYFYIDSNVLQSDGILGWHNGDFNYDGVINGEDYFIIDNNLLNNSGG